MRFLNNQCGKLPMMVIVAVACALVSAGGATLFIKMSGGNTGGSAVKQEEKKPQGDYKQWKLDDFLVTLADQDEMHYAKMNLVIEAEGKNVPVKAAAGGEGGGEMAESVKFEESKALDLLNTVISAKKLKDLLEDVGRKKLKSELKFKMNKDLEDIKVREIYITYFALQ